jgi:molecular chaperone GrpE
VKNPKDIDGELKKPDAVADDASPPEAGQTAVDEIAELKAQMDKLRHETLLQRADLENTRKRLERQKQEDMKYAALPMARELVVVVDNLELALNHASKDDPMRQGVSLVLDGILKTFSKFHIERIKAKGEKFNPSLHEAFSVVGDANMPDDTVIEEPRPGYLLHDRLVRAAGVIVNRHPHRAEEAPPDAPTPRE